VELEGQTYGLKLIWNFRAEAWFLSLYDADGQAIVHGIRLVTDYPLGKRFKDSRMPPGTFQIQDTSGERRDPNSADLGRRALLYYFTADELEG
jgi:hypothetical protein